MVRATFYLAVGLWLAVLAGLKLLIAPPIPSSVMMIYMVMATVAILVFVAANETRFANFLAPLKAVFEGRAPLAVQAVVLAGLPALLGWGVYLRTAPSDDAPFAPRTIHPQPPSSFQFNGKRMEMTGLENPFHKESDPEARIAEGKTIYYQNCFFCHGDALGGDGIFASAFSPIPANFRDVGTISMLQESYVFWRVSTGGTGLPKGSTPWSSAMPVWQHHLTEEEVWKAVLYIYAGSGSTPRTWEEEPKK